MRTRHRAHRVLAAEETGDHRVDGGFLFLLVLRQSLHDEPANGLELAADVPGGELSEPVRHGADPRELRGELAVLGAEPLGHVRGLSTGRRPARLR